jgi:hypothetical protein
VAADDDRTALEPSVLVRRAVELAGSIFELGGSTRFHVSIAPEPGEASTWLVYLEEGGQVSGFGVSIDGESLEGLVATVADRLQDAYIDHLWEARPRCPLHEHPLTASTLEGEAVWACPAESGWKRAVGSLATDPNYLAAIEQPPRL